MATELDWVRHDDRLAGILHGILNDPEAQAKMGAGHSAGLAWHSVIGDIERKHTTGVFVGRPKAPGLAPALCVYVDSRMRMVDFNANREVYLARLQARGYEYSEVRFLQNKRALPKAQREKGDKGTVPSSHSPASSSTRGKGDKGTVPSSHFELSEEERGWVEEQTAGLSPEMRLSVSKAMTACMRRQKYEGRKKL